MQFVHEQIVIRFQVEQEAITLYDKVKKYDFFTNRTLEMAVGNVFEKTIKRMMKYILSTLLSFIILNTAAFGQSERPEAIVVPVSAMGDVSETRK